MNKLLGFLVVLVLIGGIAGAYFFPQVSAQKDDTGIEDESGFLSAAPGPEVTNFFSFASALQRGGRKATTTDDTTTTLVRANFVDATRLDFVPSVPGITATLPATSTIPDLVPKPGDTRDFLICNATTTPATTFTLAFGTGMKTSLGTSTLAIATDKCAQLTFSRKTNGDINVFYDYGY